MISSADFKHMEKTSGYMNEVQMAHKSKQGFNLTQQHTKSKYYLRQLTKKENGLKNLKSKTISKIPLTSSNSFSYLSRALR
jgi:hemerythrin-like domain-containing protein